MPHICFCKRTFGANQERADRAGRKVERSGNFGIRQPGVTQEEELRLTLRQGRQGGAHLMALLNALHCCGRVFHSGRCATRSMRAASRRSLRSALRAVLSATRQSHGRTG